MEKKGAELPADYNPTVRLNKDLNEKEVSLHQKYSITEKSELWTPIDKLIEELRRKEARKEKSHLYDVCGYSYYPLFEFILMKLDPAHEMCCICQYEFKANKDLFFDITHDGHQDIVCLGRCEHLFHKDCLASYVGKNNWLKCPVCSVIYGVMMGDQPDGVFSQTVDKNMRCAGYNCGTIVINYNFKGGSRNGRAFPGTARTGYLPDNEDGRKVAKLLKVAFDRKLVFTIGRSVTTGQDNVIVWNGIHHKTNPNGGSANFGYPDPTYLIRVQEELAAKGIY